MLILKPERKYVLLQFYPLKPMYLNVGNLLFFTLLLYAKISRNQQSRKKADNKIAGTGKSDT